VKETQKMEFHKKQQQKNNSQNLQKPEGQRRGPPGHRPNGPQRANPTPPAQLKTDKIAPKSDDEDILKLLRTPKKEKSYNIFL
jgi:hypothetical protein